MEEKKDGFHLIDEKEHDSSPFDFGEIFGKAKDIVWNNKVTWIFGAAVASLASGSSRFNSNSNSGDDGSSFQKLFDSIPKDPQQSGEKISMVLGEATSPLQSFISQLWELIPTWVYVVLGVEVLILIVVGLSIQAIYAAWAQASLVNSVQDGYLNKKPTISSSSLIGFKYIKKLILLSLIPLLFLLVVIPLSVILFVLIFTLGPTALKIIGGILLFIEVLVVIYALVLLTVSLIWATRFIVISNQGTKEAFFNGLRLAKKYMWRSLLLGLVHAIGGGIILVIPWTIVVGSAISAYLAYTWENPSFGLLAGTTALLFFAALIITTFLGAIIEAFKAAAWTVAYDKVKGTIDHA